MKAVGKGSIINVASVHGIHGEALASIYAATKGGILACTRSLAAELAPFQIRVNTVSPGAIWLEMYEEARLQQVKEEDRKEFVRLFGEAMKDNHKYFQPLEMVGMPEDIGWYAVFLASDESRFLTGQNLVIDGGLTTYMSRYAVEGTREKVKVSEEKIKAWVEGRGP